MRSPVVVLSVLLAAITWVAPLAARELPADPLGSVMWKSIADRFMPEGEIVFDDRVRILAPFSAENQFHVPVTIDATALEGEVTEIIAVADLNPIPLILRAVPEQAQPFLGFRLLAGTRRRADRGRRVARRRFRGRRDGRRLHGAGRGLRGGGLDDAPR